VLLFISAKLSLNFMRYTGKRAQAFVGMRAAVPLLAGLSYFSNIAKRQSVRACAHTHIQGMMKGRKRTESTLDKKNSDFFLLQVTAYDLQNPVTFTPLSQLTAFCCADVPSVSYSEPSPTQQRCQEAASTHSTAD